MNMNIDLTPTPELQDSCQAQEVRSQMERHIKYYITVS